MPPDEKCLDRARNPYTKEPVCSLTPQCPGCPYAEKTDYEVRCHLPNTIGKDCIKNLSSICKHPILGKMLCEYYRQDKCVLPVMLKSCKENNSRI